MQDGNNKGLEEATSGNLFMQMFKPELINKFLYLLQKFNSDSLFSKFLTFKRHTKN